MLKRLSELINLAEFCLENLGLSEETIEDYRYSAFHLLERRLGTNEYVDSATILSQEEFFQKQYERGTISRKTLNWRIRDIRILAEVYEIGRFDWKVFSKNEKAELPEPFGSTLQSFLLTKKCGQKCKSCIESVCRRFLLTVEDVPRRIIVPTYRRYTADYFRRLPSPLYLDVLFFAARFFLPFLTVPSSLCIVVL